MMVKESAGIPGQCPATTRRGTPCRAHPPRDGVYCRMHDPARSDENQASRRLGGLRRRREKVVTTALDLKDVSSLDGLGRVLDIGMVDTLALENSIMRSRTLAALASVKLRWFELAAVQRVLELLQGAAAPPMPLW